MDIHDSLCACEGNNTNSLGSRLNPIFDTHFFMIWAMVVVNLIIKPKKLTL